MPSTGDHQAIPLGAGGPLVCFSPHDVTPSATPSGSSGARAVEPAPEPDITQPIKPPLVVILGPTASGKTNLAIYLARKLGGEIVSADSRQLYRYMDIGTAKPTPDERAAAPHHLLDIVTPDQSYTLAQYQRAAYRAISAITARRKLPLLVGGTGQYISAVIEGWGIPEVPPNRNLRAELETFAGELGAEALHDRLRKHDPEAADRIDFRNVRRVIRALEVFLETGTPITVLQRQSPPPLRILQLGLTMEREILYDRIDTRIDNMVRAGLLNEVRALLEAGYTWECPAMSGVGYAQWRGYFAGNEPEADAIAAIRRDTRAFARRQYTWFNGHAVGLQWIDMTTITPDDIVDRVENWLTEG
ncbi:MAG: tRNA (adenosine(37)-N6)-dimethylallyltransferase MiaA [Chloroflexi bacterium]|nr:tRNA (adenosine(37)-N6)-dimethylallyltransferase MiaA [Chloroflexota bacterium]